VVEKSEADLRLVREECSRGLDKVRAEMAEVGSVLICDSIYSQNAFSINPKHY